MITKINGKLTGLVDDTALLDVPPFEYEVLIPDFTRRALQLRIGEQISLFTILYLDGTPGQGRVTPRLVGFLTTVEREFFELFCSVDGIGAKKALRAMVRPVKDIADMVEEQNAKGLSTLPGIGPATAERMIAKLRRKMSKFALMVVRDAMQEELPRDLLHEAYEALCTLGHSEADARRMLDNLAKTKRKFTDVTAVLQAIYESRGD
ncbi:MAG TPA: helix-hairpin-helix domain-containing protein [Pirellulaceae bacterium]|nr:helix-hairpin-helix domain-containing protein [Pirellulaceae bacterium]